MALVRNTMVNVADDASMDRFRKVAPAQESSIQDSILDATNAVKNAVENSKVVKPSGTLAGKTDKATPAEPATPAVRSGGSGSASSTPAPAANPVVFNPVQEKTASAYEQAMQQLNGRLANHPGDYNSQYDQTIADLYGQIVGRGEFSYNANNDELYKQYVDQYTNKGRLAMMDTMAQAAGLTGGYGSSYGQAAGQQAYNQYLTGLNDRLLELENRAYDRWQDAGNEMRSNLGVLQDLDDRDYGRWQDSMDNWRTDLATAADYENSQYAKMMEDAQTRAAVGDFEGYNQIYGTEVAKAMLKQWQMSNPDFAYQLGQISASEYKKITGKNPPGTSSGRSSSSSTAKAQADIDADYETLIAGFKAGQISAGAVNEWVQKNAPDKDVVHAPSGYTAKGRR